MKKKYPRLISFIIFFIIGMCSYSQTVRVFVDVSPGLGAPFLANTDITTAYTNAGFSTVNITRGNINTTVTTSNYDVLMINEYYTFAPEASEFITSAQRLIAESFVNNGGHIVWIAEQVDTYYMSSAPAPANLNAITTINNVFGTNLSYGTFFEGFVPFMPRTHPSAGPGGLSTLSSLDNTSSYATLLNVPVLNKVYSPDSFGLSGPFDPCDFTTVALFPAKPVSSDGTIIISTEVQLPFYGGLNAQFNQDIAELHYNLLTGADMTAINSWSDTPSNINPSCSTS